MLPFAAKRYGAVLPGMAALSGAAMATMAPQEKNGGSVPRFLSLIPEMQAEAQNTTKGALNPNEFKPFKVIEKENLTKNTVHLRFELPNNQVSGLNVASCLVTRGLIKEKPDDVNAKAIIRPYTPTTPPDTRGYLDLIVKVYPTGKMSKFIGDLKVGDTLEMKGPINKYPYAPNIKKNIGMVAGGTGLTPMLQVIDAVLANPEDRTKLTLVYANQTPGDIILKERLDALAAQHPDRFSVHYVVDRPGWLGMFWKGSVGYITKDLLKQNMPPPDKDNLVMVCGPPPMMEAISGNKDKNFQQGELKGALKDIGYDESMVYKF
mmetsp:Transcript_28310/g.76462  ORF Transcript_28310/g.76462 Transcript_28310/m.76462 type:complete len:320 (-) Transcript_28310:580-1539(-)